MKGSALGVAAVAALGLSVGTVAAQTLASGDEVRAVFAGKTAYITHRNGATQKAFFEADGKARITEGSKVRPPRPLVRAEVLHGEQEGRRHVPAAVDGLQVAPDLQNGCG